MVKLAILLPTVALVAALGWINGTLAQQSFGLWPGLPLATVGSILMGVGAGTIAGHLIRRLSQ